MPEVFYLLLLGHIVGDFYLQSEEMAERKQKKAAAVSIHAALYCVVILIVSVPLLFLNIWAAVAAFAALSLSHLIIDLVKFGFNRNKGAEDSFTVFITDQALHIAAVITISYLLLNFISADGLTVLLRDGIGVFYPTTLKLFCVLVIMGRPANIAFKKVFKAARLKEGAESGMKNAGAIIGALERIISCVMFFLGQYAAIAIVLTAKSIARYKKLSTDPGFAEYYLTGTLSSIAFAILVSMLFFQPNL